MNEPLLELDTEARRRALEAGSFIVEAPAGAGKTELLTQRFLMLLAHVEEPEEIVAITFTNKAAAEMRNRILESLEMAAAGAVPDKAHKKVTFELARAALAAAGRRSWGLLDHPGRLRVTTIDAFCAGLARQMPLLSRFGAQPRLAEDAGRHYDEAARRALSWLDEDAPQAEVVATALSHLGNDAGRLASLLAQMLARRDQWLRHALAGRSREEAEAGLAALVQRDLERVAKEVPPRVQEVLMPVARYAACNLTDDHALAALHDWGVPLTADAAELPRWRALATLLLKEDGARREAVDKRHGFPARESKAHKETLFDVIGNLAEPAVAALVQARRLPAPEYTDEEWQTVQALAALLGLAAAELWSVFHEAGETDFVELALRARQALGSDAAPTDLALALDYRIRHLLVDEFQDTSPTQVELLQRLTAGWAADDGRSLFLVGDPMQSIYRFRKADVGLFLEVARHGLGTVPLERLSLFRNNRSCGAVVDWVNGAFAGVFPAEDDVPAGAIRYREFAAAREEALPPGRPDRRESPWDKARPANDMELRSGEHPSPPREGRSGGAGHEPNAGVQVHPLVVAKGGDGGGVEARAIVKIIDAERAAGRQIAVLVRARDHLVPLVAEIRRHRRGLHFQAVEIENLAERQVVQDLLALTRALHHRADRVSWLAILRAPWCGLRLADLHALAADDHQATVWSLINDKDRVARLSADGRARLLVVRDAMAAALRHQGRSRLRRWIEGTWLTVGGPACLEGEADLADAQAFFDLVDKLDAGGRFTPEQLEKEMARLYAAPDPLADGSLQFMTLHKAKGLEFDTVILPGLDRTTGGNDQPLMLWEEVILDGLDEHLVAAPLKRRYGLPPPPPPGRPKAGAVNEPEPRSGEHPSPPREGGAGGAGHLSTPYDYLAGLESRRSANEAARVLYVGATRAVRRLHLLGVVERNSKGELKPTRGSFLDLLWPTVGSEFLAASDAPTGDISFADAGFASRLVRLAAPVVADFALAASDPATIAAQEDDATIDPYAADIGTLVHAYLEMIAVDGLDAWPTERLARLRPAMEVWLGRRGHGDRDASLGAERAVAMLQTTLASDDGRRLLGRHDADSAELSLARAEEQGASTHVVDRTFVDGGVRWIVDYKTAAVEGDAAAHAERYRPQLERYAALFAGEGLPIRMGVFYTAIGRLIILN